MQVKFVSDQSLLPRQRKFFTKFTINQRVFDKDPIFLHHESFGVRNFTVSVIQSSVRPTLDLVTKIGKFRQKIGHNTTSYWDTSAIIAPNYGFMVGQFNCISDITISYCAYAPYYTVTVLWHLEIFKKFGDFSTEFAKTRLVWHHIFAPNSGFSVLANWTVSVNLLIESKRSLLARSGKFINLNPKLAITRLVNCNGHVGLRLRGSCTVWCFGVGQFNRASEIWLRLTTVAMVMKIWKYIHIIIIIRHAPSAQYNRARAPRILCQQCVAPLAANSLHSGLFRASSIASSKLGRSSQWPSRRCRVAQLAFSTHSGDLQSEFSWRLLTRPFWPDDQTAWVFFSV